MKYKSKTKQRKTTRKQERNWLDLPSDVMANILYRVGVIDILENAQKVCTTWRSICKDPAMWKVICIENFWDPCARPPLYEISKHAIDRSQGQLVDLTIVDVCSHVVLTHLAPRSSQLRRLDISYCYGDLYDGWAEVTEPLKTFPRLEELSLRTTDFSQKDIEAVGRCCPLLITLKDNRDVYGDYGSYDEKALAIGKSLPGLRNLELIGDSMSNIGLQAILDGCRHLESLDLRKCFYIDLKGDLGKRCVKQIKYLKLPYDPLDKEIHITGIEPKVYKWESDDQSSGYSSDDYKYDSDYCGYSSDHQYCGYSWDDFKYDCDYGF